VYQAFVPEMPLGFRNLKLPSSPPSRS